MPMLLLLWIQLRMQLGNRATQPWVCLTSALQVALGLVWSIKQSGRREAATRQPASNPLAGIT